MRLPPRFPGALVHCGDLPALNALEVPNPVIVVEVLSPSSMRRDLTRKVAGYFKVESIRHYLIADAEEAVIITMAGLRRGFSRPRLSATGKSRSIRQGLYCKPRTCCCRSNPRPARRK
ncbi:MAG: hypothetical protein ACLP7P_04045 [Rhodomicrobium sp.]